MKFKKRAKKVIWFKQVRGSYLPVSWQGWALYVPMIYVIVASFNMIMDKNYSAQEMILMWLPYLVSTVVVMHWLAAKTSK